MADLIDAVRQNLHPFGPDHPFAAADAMVLSQLVYLNMPDFVPRIGKTARKTHADGTVDGGTDGTADNTTDAITVATGRGKVAQTSVSLSALLRREDYPSMVGTMNRADRVTELIRVCGESPRYRDILVGNMAEPSGPHDDDRFAAMTFLVPDGRGGRVLVVAYRGTDSTLAGWYEDFRLLFLTPPLPSQSRAARYLAQVAATGSLPLILTGHSWGGNLAEYAAGSAAPDVQRRIVSVWSQDAPGFTADFIASPGFRRIAPRLHRAVPTDSLVGMLFDAGVEETVVASSAHGIAQHFLTTWQFAPATSKKSDTNKPDVNRPGTKKAGPTPNTDGSGQLRLVTAAAVSRPSAVFGTVIDKWRTSVDTPTRRRLIDDLFVVLRATGHDNFSDIAADWPGSLRRAGTEFRKLEPSEQAMIREVLRALWGVLTSLPGPLSREESGNPSLSQSSTPQSDPSRPGPGRPGSQSQPDGPVAEL